MINGKKQDKRENIKAGNRQVRKTGSKGIGKRRAVWYVIRKHVQVFVVDREGGR